MNYKIIFLYFFLVLNSCIEHPIKNIEKKNVKKDLKKEFFINKGFALIYSSDLISNKFVDKKFNDRDLLIFQKNLKRNTTVKITNLINNKSILAKVGSSANYPIFYNSVVSKRIADELNLSKEEPYIEIKELMKNSSFVAKVAKTFDEEKKVASKAPVDEIKISNLSNNIKKESKYTKKKFSYLIKIADFYFKDSANSLVSRIQKETPIKKIMINKLTESKYRVYLGPFDNINLLQKVFNDIKILEFENIEYIYND